MTVKRRNTIPANWKFNPDVIPPMFDATTAMEILLNRRKNPVYLSDIFTVEKYLTEEEKNEREIREREKEKRIAEEKRITLNLLNL
jgi:hypothetical protein